MPLSDLIQLRRDTLANWTSVNPVLAIGETGFVTDRLKFKLGDGVNTFNNLPFFPFGTVTNVELTSPSNDILVTGSSITDNGTFAVGLNTTGVLAGGYGDSSKTISLSVDAKGRITEIGENSPILNASAIVAGTLDNTRLSSAVTLEGNSFNSNNQLVKLTSDGKLPAIDGSLLTNLTGSGEVNVGQNINTTGIGVYSAKLGTALRFKGLTGTSRLTITDNVENNSIDLDVAISSLTGIAQSQITNLTSDLAGKEPVIAAGSVGQYFSYNKTWQALNLAAIGVTNSDAISQGSSNLYLTGAERTKLGNILGTNTGDQTISLSGDVSGSGTSAITVNLGAGVVTYSKFQNVTASNRLLGRATTGAGVVEEIILGTNLSLSGNTLNAAGGSGSVTLSGDVTGTGSNSITTTISNLALTKLATQATSTFLGRSTAGTGTPEVLSIATAKTLLNLTGTNSGDQTITLSGAITGSGTGAITTTFGTQAANSILGNNTGSAAAPTALTAAQVKTVLSLSNVENTALSTWTGSPNVTTLGTIATGVWSGTAIADSYISSAAIWTAKQSVLVSGTNIKTVNGNSLLGSGDLVVNSGDGEINTASNVGAGGVGVFKQKTGVNLEFRNINTASSNVSVSLDAVNNEIDLDVVPANFTGIPQSGVTGLVSALETYLPLAGGTLTGPLMLSTSVTGAAPGAIYRNAGTLRYRDSGNGERIILNATDNLASLTSLITARTNLGLGSLATQSGTFSGTSSGTNTGDQTITLTGDVTGSGTNSFATTLNTVTIAKGGTGATSVSAARANLSIQNYGYTSVTDAAYTVLVTDSWVVYTSLTAARVVTLPAASAVPAGWRLLIADGSGSCSATNTLTLTRAGLNTINGATTEVMNAPYTLRMLQSDGVSNWYFDAGIARINVAQTLTNKTLSGASNTLSNIELSSLSTLAANTILGNNTGSAAVPIALTTAQTKTLLALNNVENTALSTWAGTSNITQLGTISSGTWNGTAINDTYISSATTWNAKQSALVSGTNIRTINGNSLLGSTNLVIGASGANTQIQFNSSGSFAGSSGLTWNGSTLSATSTSVLGTAGSGYREYNAQSSSPSAPVAGYRQYADNTGRFIWIGSNGFTRTFDGASNTADRSYTLPNASGTIALQSWAQKLITVSTVAPTNLDGVDGDIWIQYLP